MNELSKQAYDVLVNGYTELPYTGEFLHNDREGNYLCGYCDNLIFSSIAKFDSLCGWPSFYESHDNGVIEVSDGDRTEVCCRKCNSHLGHVFSNEGFDTPTNRRFCINSVAMKFIENNVE